MQLKNDSVLGSIILGGFLEDFSNVSNIKIKLGGKGY